MALFLLTGCGEPKTETLQPVVNEPAPETFHAGFNDMPDEKLLQEVARLKEDCRQAPDDATKPSSTCSLVIQAEGVAEGRGWCWGPRVAESSDKSWLRCEDDEARGAQLSEEWYAIFSSGNCRKATPQEAVKTVLGHGDPWNVKTVLTVEGFLEISSRQSDGNVRTSRLYPSCDDARMAYIASPNGPGRFLVSIPLGLSAREAGNLFGFDERNCGGYSFGSGLGCMKGLTEGSRPPIRLSDGFTPCRVGGIVQYDFQLPQGMVGVTCSASLESLREFNNRMETAFGVPKLEDGGGKLWRLGRYSARSYGQSLPKVSFFLDGV